MRIIYMTRTNARKTLKKRGGSPEEEYSDDFEDVRAELRAEKYNIRIKEINKEIAFYTRKLPEYQKQIDEKTRIIQKYTGNDTYANKIEYMKQFIKAMETKKRKTEEHIKEKERELKKLDKKMKASDMVITEESPRKKEKSVSPVKSNRSSASSIDTVKEDTKPDRKVKPMIRHNPNLTIITNFTEEGEMVHAKRVTKPKPAPAALQAMIKEKERTRKNTESYLQGLIRGVRNVVQPQKSKNDTRKVQPVYLTKK